MKTRNNYIIAIDGFSSCGKSTIAKALARKLDFLFIDTGAMYRAVTLSFVRQGIDCHNPENVQKAISDIQIDLVPKSNQVMVLLNGEDVTDAIRTMEVSSKVSEVSTIKLVRDALVKQQQLLGSKKNVVMDGRDIGTTVFPDADLKIFLTASLAIRAERRFAELANKNATITMQDVLDNLAQRDHIDSNREESPLRKAEDAILLDNSHMTHDEQLSFVLEKYYAVIGK